MSSSILGAVSDVFLWVIVFALPVVAMTLLHMYLSMRRGSVEYGYLVGMGLFLLLELALMGGIHLVPTMVFLMLLLPGAVKTFASTVKGSADGEEGDSTATNQMVEIVVDGGGSVGGESASNGGVDVLLVKCRGVVRGVSALRVNPATSTVQPQSCVTLLTALSKFHEQQGRGGFVEWVFKVDVPQNGGGVDYKFMIVTEGKLKKGKEDECQGRVVELVKVATLYLRSALRSVGLVEEDEVSVMPPTELLETVNRSGDTSGSVGDEEGGEPIFDVVAVRGLPKKIVEVEEEAYPFSSSPRRSYAPSSSSVESQLMLLQHPVGGLLRLMVADGIAGSYVVRFTLAKPPERASIVDDSLLDAAMLTANGGGGMVGDGYVRGAGGRLPLQMVMRNSVAGRLRLADGEDLAGEAVSGVRRGYWNVGVYVAIRKTENNGKYAADLSSPSAAAVKIASALVSCFSGGARSIDARIIEDEGSYCGLLGGYPLETMTTPQGRGLPPAVGTGEMSSDSLASFIALSPPYPVPTSDASLLAEFEIPPSGSNGLNNGNGNDAGNGNGLLHLGRAYFRGTPVGDVKIRVEDLSMHLAVLGETGYGKTRFVADLLKQLWDLDPTINWLIVDLKGEYHDQLQPHIGERIEVLKAEGNINRSRHGSSGVGGGLLRIDLLNDVPHIGDDDKGVESERIGRLFSALKESLAGLFKENAELSPMMERILLESLKQVMTATGNGSGAADGNNGGGGFFDALFSGVENYVDHHKRRDVVMSGEALKNRLERFRRGVIGDILNHNYSKDKVKRSFATLGLREMLRTRKTIIDLSGCARKGCSKEDIRLLLNVITSVIFEEAFRRGLVGAPALRHLTVVEEANILVPDVLRRRTMGDLTATEDMILTARGFGEGLVLVAQRPTVSSFVLANAGTKVVFRSPYDSLKVGEFMGLSEEQQNAVKTIRKFEAVVTTVQGGPYRISTAKPQKPAAPLSHPRKRQLEPVDSSLFPPVASASEVIGATQNERTSMDEDTSDDGKRRVVVDEGDVKRVLRRSSSGKLRLFKKVASSSTSQSEIGVSDVVRSVFGGNRWEYLDALRSLTDLAVWRRPLLAVVDETATLRLTDYGREVWRAMQQRQRKSGRW